MHVQSLNNLKRYANTYWQLSVDFLRFTGLRGQFVVLLIAAFGFLFPLPLALLVRAMLFKAEGKQTMPFSLPLMEQVAQVSTMMVIYGALLAYAAVLYANYLLGRSVIRMNMAWQDTMIWDLLNRIPHASNVAYRQIIDKQPPQRYINRVLDAVRGGFHIGRVITLGMQHFGIAVVAMGILAWTGPSAVIVLLVITVVVLPVYARLLLQLTRVRHESQSLGPIASRQAVELVQGVLSTRPDLRFDARSLQSNARQILRPAYSITNKQYYGLTTINFFVGIHLIASLMLILFLGEYHDQLGLGAAIDSGGSLFFVGLILLIRSVLVLINLFARLTRGYSRLAMLRTLLHPERKDLDACKGRTGFLQRDTSGNVQELELGDAYCVLSPPVQYAFELRYLSNSITDCTPIASECCSFIPLLDSENLDWLNPDADRKHTLSHGVEISDASVDLQLAARGFVPDDVPLIAVTEAAWGHLTGKDWFADVKQKHVFFIIMSAERFPWTSYAEFPAVASDGSNILALGALKDLVVSQGKKILHGKRSKRDARADLEDDLDEDF